MARIESDKSPGRGLALGLSAASSLLGAISLAATSASAAPGGIPGPAAGTPAAQTGSGPASNSAAAQAGPSSPGGGTSSANSSANSSGGASGEGNSGAGSDNGQGGSGGDRGNGQANPGSDQGSHGSPSSAGGQAPGSKSNGGASSSAGGNGQGGGQSGAAGAGQGGGPGSAHADRGGGSDGGQKPPGNNGTIKIEGATYDGGMDNDPHLTCSLSVSFFGYDAGTQSASLVFSAVNPTPGGSTRLTTSWTTTQRTGGNQLDTNYPVSDLSSLVAGLSPSKQGYHIALTVYVSGSQGADTKHKVFWYKPCAAPAPAVSTPSVSVPAPVAVLPAVASIQPTSVSGFASTESTSPRVLGLTLETAYFRPWGGTWLRAANESTVRPTTSSRPGSPQPEVEIAGVTAPVPVSELPFTGSQALSMALIGLGLTGSGSILSQAARRRRTA